MAKKRDIIQKSEMMAINNAITGELETAKVTVFVERNKPRYRDNFTIFFQAVNMALVRDIKPITAKMLLYFCSCVEYNNSISKNIEDIGKELCYSRQRVSIALKELSDKNIISIEKHPTDKRCNIYRLNPYQSWKGKPTDRMSEIKGKYQQLQLPFYNNVKKQLLEENANFDKEQS